MSNQQEVTQKEGPSAPAIGKPESSPLKAAIPETLSGLDIKGLGKKKAADVMKSFGNNIAVRPYVDNTKENMGLEKYNYAIYPGTSQVEQLAAIERNGIVRYVTGLDEFAPEVQHLQDPEKKAAIIYNIRFIVSELEKQLATNVIKVDDENFWDKVSLLKPNNHEFWGKITIKCSNDPLFLNPKNDPYDLVKLMAIEAGGFDLIAKSYEDAQTRAKPPKFFLDKEIDTSSTRTELKKLRNSAISILDALASKSPKKLFYIAKVVDLNSTQYKNSTPQDTIYDNVDEFIHGNGVEGNKTKAAQKFLDAAQLSMEDLKLKALIKDASFYKFIISKPDGMLYHAQKSAILGRNVADVLEYLKNPMNEDILEDLLAQVEKYWNN